MTWTPILSGPERERALEIVGAIAEDLRARFAASAQVDREEAWSLATGVELFTTVSDTVAATLVLVPSVAVKVKLSAPW